MAAVEASVSGSSSNSSFHHVSGPVCKQLPSTRTRLLRKPRAPVRNEKPAFSPAPKSYSSELNSEYARYLHGHSRGQPGQDLEPLSPPPSSDFPAFSDTDSLTQSTAYPRYTHSHKSAIRRDDMKYVLDPLYRDKTSLGTYVEGKSLVQPFKARGPDPLPYRQPKRPPHVITVMFDDDFITEDRYIPPAGFCLQDFLLRVSEKERIPLEKLTQAVLSRHNYKKLQKLIAEQNAAKSHHLSTINVELPDDIPPVMPRIPEQQFLLELTAMYKEQMMLTHDIQADSIKTAICPLPRYSPSYQDGSAPPHTEIVLYEDRSQEDKKILERLHRQDTELPGKENIFHSVTSRYFQGARRTNSPFALTEDMISPSELAVLDTLMAGGEALSLKAHFISQLPELEPVSKTITYLNISFNDFRIIPYEIFEIVQLEVLKMRNNPLKEIQPEICRLKKLRTLVFSFCLVSSLPLSLFKLKKLQHLDFAYNRVSFIPNEISNLRKLRELNIEGNQIPAMPVGALKLHKLKYLRLKNNFMNPLFWRDNSKNESQRLVDLSALCFTQYELRHRYASLPEAAEKILSTHSSCDCCQGPLYGTGLRIIRPVSRIFGIKYVPFLFNCCSSHCHKMFMKNSDCLVDMLYGNSQSDKKNGSQETTQNNNSNEMSGMDGDESEGRRETVEVGENSGENT